MKAVIRGKSQEYPEVCLIGDLKIVILTIKIVNLN